MDVLKNTRFAIHLAVFSLVSIPLFSQSVFVGLSEAESAILGTGQPVTRTADYKDRLAIPSSAPGADVIRSSVKDLKPNYLVETFVSLKDDGSDLSAVLSETLSMPDTWLKIPYVAQRSKKLYDLFDKCVVESRSDLSGGGRTFDVLHLMKPFDDYSSRYELRSDRDWVTFSGVNQTHLVYKGVKAVSPGNMLWRISAWRENGSWHFYGIGAVKAFDLFGAARSRLEPSFIGRTEAFFDFMRGRLDSPRP